MWPAAPVVVEVYGVVGFNCSVGCACVKYYLEQNTTRDQSTGCCGHIGVLPGPQAENSEVGGGRGWGWGVACLAVYVCGL